MPDINIDSEEGMGINLDTHYNVLNSWNDPVNIYSYVRTYHKDPAITVSLSFEHK